jgi:hypothetical protein
MLANHTDIVRQRKILTAAMSEAAVPAMPPALPLTKMAYSMYALRSPSDMWPSSTSTDPYLAAAAAAAEAASSMVGGVGVTQ